jgi:hypothetical protein
MSEKHFCDLCGKECSSKVQHTQMVFKGGCWGCTEQIETCLDCTIKISKLMRAAGMFAQKKEAMKP